MATTCFSGDKGNDEIEGGPGYRSGRWSPSATTRNSTAEPDNDFVFGGAGSDNAGGGEGDGDVVRGDSGEDSLDGGARAQGHRLLRQRHSQRCHRSISPTERSKGDGHDTMQGFEDVVGSPQGDDIVGDSEDLTASTVVSATTISMAWAGWTKPSAAPGE